MSNKKSRDDPEKALKLVGFGKPIMTTHLKRSTRTKSHELGRAPWGGHGFILGVQ